MSDRDEDNGSSSSSTSSLKQVPLLRSIDDFDIWRPLIEHFIIDCGCGRILEMDVQNYDGLVKKRNQLLASNSVYLELGISFPATKVVSTVKQEEESKSNEINVLSDAAKKELMKVVKESERVYTILYRAIPQSLRVQVGVEHKNNGNSLWKWIVSKLEPTSTGMQMERYDQLVAIRQQPGERFATYKARIDRLNDKLASTGDDLKPKQYRHTVLSRTHEKYRQIVISVEMNKELQDDSNDRAGMWIKIVNVITEFERTYLKDEIDLTSETAMAATEQRKSQYKRDYSKTTCFKCGEVGHIKWNCKNKKKLQSESEQASSAVTVSPDTASDQASSVHEAVMFSAIAAPSKLSYAAIVGASIAMPRAPAPTPAAASSSVAATQLTSKRLHHGPPPALSKPKVTSSSSSSASKSPAVSTASPASSNIAAHRNQVLRDAKKPGPTSSKAGRPLEHKLKRTSWGIDSMASVHCTGNKTLLSTRRSCTPMSILCANGDKVVAKVIGSVNLSVRSRAGSVRQLRVNDVYYCEDLSANLLSSCKLSKDLGMAITIEPNSTAYLKSESGVIYPLRTVQSILTLDTDVPAIVYAATSVRVIKTVSQLYDEHCRLSHMGFDRLVKVMKAGTTRGLGRLDMSAEDLASAREQIMHCNACKVGKGTQRTYSHSGPLNHGSAPGEVIHVDTFESRVPQMSALQYGIVIVDPYTSALFCPMVATKDKVASTVIAVLKHIQVCTGNKVKVLHSDGGTEFLNHTLKSFCAENGTVMQQSSPRTPKHNGIAERYVRTIKDGARTMLAHCGLTGQWASRAIAHFIYIWNRTVISDHTKKTPYQSYHKMEPSVSSTNVFGCDVYVWLHKDTREAGTYAPRGEPGIYLGHDAQQNCAVVWLIKSAKEVRSRSVDYRERSFKYAHALIAGRDSINQVVIDSDEGGSLAWSDSVEDSIELRLNQISQSADDQPLPMIDESVSSQIQEGSEFDDDDSQPQYAVTVEKIMSHKASNKSDDGFLYRVKWEGYSINDATWEPSRSFLGGADEIYTEYRTANGLTDADEVKVDEEESASH